MTENKSISELGSPAEVFANVTVMVLKHFWDPMTEISGVTWLQTQNDGL